MAPPDADPDQKDTKLPASTNITIDPQLFFQHASSCPDLWQELIGLSITHCTFGPGIITRIDGDYIFVNLPARPGKKQLTEFGLNAFQRGYFRNLQIDAALQERITTAVRLSHEQPPPAEAPETSQPAAPRKKKRATTKAAKKTAL